MKKVLAMVLALLMLLGGAMAEEQNGYAPLELGMDLEINVDLDGDGAEESVSWTRVKLSEHDEEAVVTVKAGSGESLEWRSGMLYDARVWVTDIDSNGLKEIFVTGDEMSDDYVTYCLNFAGMMLEQLLFVDANRGENTADYYAFGYGWFEPLDQNRIKLTGSQDMLGTWQMSREFSLVDGVFEFADDGYWYCEMDLTDPELWEYRSLIPVQAIPVTFVADGVETAGELQIGEHVLLTRFDKVSTAYFITEDGREGYFTAEPDVETGWGLTINGIPESDLFEVLPYAD